LHYKRDDIIHGIELSEQGPDPTLFENQSRT